MPPSLEARPPETQVDPYVDTAAPPIDDIAGTVTLTVTIFDGARSQQQLPALRFTLGKTCGTGTLAGTAGY